MVLFKDNEFPDGERFIIHYEEDGFETYVEVFPDLSTKTYHTRYIPSKTIKTFDRLKELAEEVAMEECIKKYYA